MLLTQCFNVSNFTNLFFDLNIIFFHRFHQIILNRSNSHLRAVFEEYEKLSKMTLEQAIKSEMSGDIMNGLVTFGN